VKDGEVQGTDAAALDGFDVGMLQAVVGELPYPTLQKLKDVSSSNVERGDYCQMDEGEPCTDTLSNQPIP
jgi:hypothetical protein